MNKLGKNPTLNILPMVFIILGIVLIIIGAVAIWRIGGSGTPTVTAPAPTEQLGGEPSYPEVPRVSLEDARKAYDEGSAVFVDVRATSIFADSHIPGALNIPSAEIASRLEELDPGKWIITYCT